MLPAKNLTGIHLHLCHHHPLHLHQLLQLCLHLLGWPCGQDQPSWNVDLSETLNIISLPIWLCRSPGVCVCLPWTCCCIRFSASLLFCHYNAYAAGKAYDSMLLCIELCFCAIALLLHMLLKCSDGKARFYACMLLSLYARVSCICC